MFYYKWASTGEFSQDLYWAVVGATKVAARELKMPPPRVVPVLLTYASPEADERVIAEDPRHLWGFCYPGEGNCIYVRLDLDDDSKSVRTAAHETFHLWRGAVHEGDEELCNIFERRIAHQVGY